MKKDMILLFLALWPMAGAFIGYLIGRKDKKARDYFTWIVCLVECVLALSVLGDAINGNALHLRIENVLANGLTMKLDGFRALHALLAGLMWLLTGMFSKEYLAKSRNRNRYYFFNMLTFGATVGVFLSGDLFTTFVFFEIMSMASYVLVAHDESKETMRAAGTYLAVGVLGGMVMLMGLFLLQNTAGTLDLDLLVKACEGADKTRLWAASLCLLFGFGAKAGMYPLHFWSPTTYPAAPAPATALLSGILSKAGVFGVLITGCYVMHENKQWGYMMLVLAVITIVLGGVLGIFADDMKRILACSSMSQIGFILVGAAMINLLGEENALAVRGTLLHMINHSLFKLILFMVAGVIFMNLGTHKLDEIRGFGKNKPLLHFIYLMPALGIAGVPLWNGFVSKTLLHESIVEYTEMAKTVAEKDLLHVSEWVFLFSGGLTLAYMLKAYICIFWEKNNDAERQAKMDEMKGSYMSPVTAAVLTLPAVILPVLGILPTATLDKVADLGQSFMFGAKAHTVHYFSPENLKGGAISLTIGVLVYLLIVRVLLMHTCENGQKEYINAWPQWLSLEEKLYRPVFMAILPYTGAFFSRICDKLVDSIVYLLHRTVLKEAKHQQRYKLFSFQRFNSRETSVQKEITGSFSFGLLLFGVGVCAVLIYLVLV